jgi:integrase
MYILSIFRIQRNLNRLLIYGYVALATAMRCAELLNCTWGDIDFDAQTIEVYPEQDTEETWEWLIKDADHRTLPLTEEIVQMLADHQARQPEGYPMFLFPQSGMTIFGTCSGQMANGPS